MGKIVQISEANGKLSDFDLFWEVYPKHKAKLDAMKAWRQTEKIRPCIEEILAAIQEQQRSNDWIKDGGQFVPLPASWLRGGRWLDED